MPAGDYPPNNYWYWQPPVYFPTQPTGQKCELCGSTAIDHTEQQCQINRTLNKRIKK